MEVIKRKDIEEVMLPGRFMQKLVGSEAEGYPYTSGQFHIGYCRYCAQAGPMSPHVHREEVVQVLSADRAWVRFGPSADELPHKVMLEKDMTLHIPSGQWHVFEYEEGGSLEILFIYGPKIQL